LILLSVEHRVYGREGYLTKVKIMKEYLLAEIAASTKPVVEDCPSKKSARQTHEVCRGSRKTPRTRHVLGEILIKSTFCASAGGVALTRRGDGSVATVVARMASGKKVRIYENSRTIGAAILHIHAHERVPFRLFLIPIG
jgi:hypothetical protein